MYIVLKLAYCGKGLQIVNVRLWSKYECEKQVLELWGNIPNFLDSYVDVAPKSRYKVTVPHLLPLAVTIDAGKPFAQATYYEFESNGPVALKCLA